MHTRRKHYKAIFGPWWAAVNGLWAILSGADTLVGKYGSDQVKTAWDATWLHPKWGWKVWLMGFVAITAAFAIEFSFRQIRKVEAGAAAENNKLRDELEEELTRNEMPEIKGSAGVAFSVLALNDAGHPILTDTQLFILLKLVNHREVNATIDKYELTLMVGKDERTVVGEPLFKSPIKIIHESDYRDLSSTSSEFLNYMMVYPISMRIGTGSPLRRGISADGWVSFYIKNAHLDKAADSYEDFAITLTDSLGNTHNIPAKHTRVIFGQIANI